MVGTACEADLGDMYLVAVVLTASITVDIDLGRLFRAHAQRAPQVTCGISTVGYRFIGKAGQRFQYAGDSYVIPAEGWIELIADRRHTKYVVDGKSLPADDSPRDQFGFRDVVIGARVEGASQ